MNPYLCGQLDNLFLQVMVCSHIERRLIHHIFNQTHQAFEIFSVRLII